MKIEEKNDLLLRVNAVTHETIAEKGPFPNPVTQTLGMSPWVLVHMGLSGMDDEQWEKFKQSVPDLEAANRERKHGRPES